MEIPTPKPEDEQPQNAQSETTPSEETEMTTSGLLDLLSQGVDALKKDEESGTDDAKNAFADMLKKMGHFK